MVTKLHCSNATEYVPPPTAVPNAPAVWPLHPHKVPAILIPSQTGRLYAVYKREKRERLCCLLHTALHTATPVMPACVQFRKMTFFRAANQTLIISETPVARMLTHSLHITQQNACQKNHESKHAGHNAHFSRLSNSLRLSWHEYEPR